MDQLQIKRIGWAEQNYDMALDRESVLIEESTGHKGLGGIVAVLFGLALLIAIFLTIWQMATGNATGNPVGAIIFLSLMLGWPTLWGVLQFFRRRRFYLEDGIIYFEFIGLFGRKKTEVSTADYKQLTHGRTASASRSEGGIGRTGYYFLKIRHTKPKYNILFYRNIPGPMPEERIQRYSEILGLPIETNTRRRTDPTEDYKKEARAIIRQFENAKREE